MVAQASSNLPSLPEAIANDASGAKDSKDSAEPQTELKPLKEVITGSEAKAAEKPAEAAPKTEKSEKKSESPEKEKPANPAVEADKLVRQAQRELQEGNRDEALATAKRAAELDSNNVEATALIAELGAGPAASTGLALPPLGAAAPAPSL